MVSAVRGFPTRCPPFGVREVVRHSQALEMAAVELDVAGARGRIRLTHHGSARAPLVLGVHGLTSTRHQLAKIGRRVADAGLRFAALDMRGRGGSARTPSGTYGWMNHALDVVAVADALGADRFAVVGVSMGGAVAMKTAELVNDRVDAVVLIDIAGRVDPGVGCVIAEVIATADPGIADPVAIAEDRVDATKQDPYRRWRHLTMPTLLIRATREIRPGAGHVVPVADRDRFVAAVPTSTVVEVDGTHRDVADSELTSVAIVDFLRATRALAV